MDFDNLSDNGIEKVLSNAPSVVQIIDFQVRQKGDSNFFIVQLSDGFSRLKKCVIMPQAQIKVKKFDVIKTQIVTPNIKDGIPLHVLIDQYSLVRNDIPDMIGEPINYADWEKTKFNGKGDNVIPPKKGGNGKNVKAPGKQGVNMAALFDDEEENAEKQKYMNNNKNSNIQGMNRKVSQISSTQSITHSTKLNAPQAKNMQNNYSNQGPPQSNNRSSSIPPMNIAKQPQNLAKPQQNNRTPPPQRQQPRHDRTYTLIKQLYQGMQDWKLKLRIIFMSELRTYVKKANGQQSQVFAFQACDQYDSLQFSVFGDSAANFSQIIELDNVYEIVGGRVIKDQQRNKLKVMLTEKSVINVREDDMTIPMVDEYCITPEKLLQKQIGTDCNVVALVKDMNQIVEFVSKNGKNCKKKEIFLCDPEAQIQVPLTLWFQKAEIKFQKIPYAFQGITVSSFKDQKQFSTSIRFNFRPFKQHQFRKFITTFQKMKLENPVHDFSGKNKPNFQLINFYVLRTEAEKLQNANSLTMEKVCYLTQISITSKNFYMSCPYCKRKVIEEENGSCSSQKCGKAYPRAKYRYLLNISLSDETETIWATAYDEAAEVMLTSDIDGSYISADEYAKIDQEDIKLRIPAFLDREMKVTIVAKKETYNGQQRVKYGINKASLEIDYANESKIMGKQMEFLMEGMQGN